MTTPDTAETTVQDDIRKSQTGDTAAFGRVVRTLHDYAFQLAFRLLCEREEANDVVQEAFIKAWHSLDRYDSRSKFTTWLYTIVSNLSLDRLRARKRWGARFTREGSADSSSEPSDGLWLDEQYSNEELAGIIRRLTRFLPPKQRLIFTLRDLQDLPVEEVAKNANMSAATIKANLHYARRAIRDHLASHYDIEGT